MQKVLEPLQKVRSIPLLSGAEGEDIDEWISAGVPGGSITADQNKYFKFHHTNGSYSYHFKQYCNPTFNSKVYNIHHCKYFSPRIS